MGEAWLAEPLQGTPTRQPHTQPEARELLASAWITFRWGQAARGAGWGVIGTFFLGRESGRGGSSDASSASAAIAEAATRPPMRCGGRCASVLAVLVNRCRAAKGA